MGRTFARGLDLLDRDLAQADVADLAGVLHLLEHAELLVGGDGGVDAVELVERDRSSFSRRSDISTHWRR